MKYISLIIPAISVMVLSTSCAQNDRHSEDQQKITVTVALPEIDSLVLHKSYPAYITAINETEIVARVNGYIVAKEFTDGDFVKAGQPLFIIESTSYQDAVNQAESNLRESEAAIKTAKARLQSARTMLSYCTTRAPYDCYVAKPTVDVNDYVAGEASPVTLVKVYDNSRMHVNFSIDNDAFIALKETVAGRKVDLDHIPITFKDSIMTTYYGKLDYEAPSVDKSTGTVTLRILVQNPKNELKSGMYADVALPYAVEPHVIVVRDASLGTDQLGKYLYTVNDSDMVVYTPVKAGELYRDTLRVISSGLRPTDRYVTEALLKVRDGMKVNPVQSAHTHARK